MAHVVSDPEVQSLSVLQVVASTRVSVAAVRMITVATPAERAVTMTDAERRQAILR